MRSCRAPLRDGALISLLRSTSFAADGGPGFEPLDLGFSGGAGAGSDIPSLIYPPDRPLKAALCAESDAWAAAAISWELRLENATCDLATFALNFAER